MAESQPRPRRGWGSVKQERSGRWRARYRTAPGAPYVSAPSTFTRRQDAERWLDRVRVDLERGEHRDPRLGTKTVAEFGAVMKRHLPEVAAAWAAAASSSS